MVKGFYKDIVKLLRAHGFEYWKNAKGSHEYWRHKEGHPVVLVAPNSLSRHTANNVMKSAGIDHRF